MPTRSYESYSSCIIQQTKIEVRAVNSYIAVGSNTLLIFGPELIVLTALQRASQSIPLRGLLSRHYEPP